jgi:hypothetical protein
MVDLETALKEEFGIGPEPPEIVARCQKNGYPKVALTLTEYLDLGIGYFQLIQNSKSNRYVYSIGRSNFTDQISTTLLSFMIRSISIRSRS